MKGTVESERELMHVQQWSTPLSCTVAAILPGWCREGLVAVASGGMLAAAACGTAKPDSRGRAR